MAVVHKWRVEIHQRYAGKATNKRNKLVEIIHADPGHGGADKDYKKTEAVLPPLDVRIVLASPAKELLARDLDGRKDL